MKRIIALLIGFSTLAFTVAEDIKNDSISISPNSQLLIKGKSNVNKFTCQFDVVNINDPIPLHYKVVDNKMLFENTALVLNNSCFDCGNRMINKDFNDLLKTDRYPQIILRLKEIVLVATNGSKVNALVGLNIAGISRTYAIALEVSEGEPICVSGSLGLNINDFDLKAPKKAMGLIVVSEVIEIEFNLILRKM